jgi:hypothetical protein
MQLYGEMNFSALEQWILLICIVKGYSSGAIFVTEIYKTVTNIGITNIWIHTGAKYILGDS